MAGKVGHRGFGHLRRLPSGRVQASYVAPDAVRYVAPRTFDTREDAEAWLTEAYEQLLERGITSVSLYHEGRPVYGPMSLTE